MLTVIVEKIVTAFAEPGTRTQYDIVTARLIRSQA
jgi:hypothetical protein